MIAEHIFNAHGLGDGVFSHGNTTRSGKIILGDSLSTAGILGLIVSADEDSIAFSFKS